ncbi:hypothetical protein GFS31_32850 [Leptolyngbya sp. BL0902]|nr:hypothetical protein GFS31_32850 [Leptolyngbya sp. BL0902]
MTRDRYTLAALAALIHRGRGKFKVHQHGTAQPSWYALVQ